jgi:hypothetical protein
LTPKIYPATIIDGGVGETNISSIVRAKNLEENITKETFIYELVITESIISPGITKAMYGTPLISPIRDPKKDPKMVKYRMDVITAGKRVCGHKRIILTVSLLTKVYRAINLPFNSILF